VRSAETRENPLHFVLEGVGDKVASYWLTRGAIDQLE
jgi:hypothetical protein